MQTEKKIFEIHPVIKRANIVALFCFLLFIIARGLDLYFRHFILENNLNETPLEILTTLPEFSLPKLNVQNNDLVTNKDFLGKNKDIVVHFWATWCAPCLTEFPSIIEYAKKNPNTQFVFINVNDDLRKAKNLLKNSEEMNITHLYDQTMNVSKNFGTFKLPETYFFNELGKLKKKIQGEGEWK